MCHSLFRSGSYYLPTENLPASDVPSDEVPEAKLISTLGSISGILGHIHHVKDSVDDRDELQKKKNPTSARKLYTRFLAYKYFVLLDRPLIVCEGKTDSVYLKCAIKKLTAFHPKLGSLSGNVFNSAVSFLNYKNQAHSILELSGGTGDLKYFILRYNHLLWSFKHRPLRHPVIILIDNDSGANDIFSVIKEKYDKSINLKSSSPFYHLTDNLYLIKAPEHGSTGVSCIENLFHSSLLEIEMGGKKFNPDKIHGSENEYGKVVFAEKVVRPNADTIDFSEFTPLFKRIAGVIDHYEPPTATKP